MILQSELRKSVFKIEKVFRKHKERQEAARLKQIELEKKKQLKEEKKRLRKKALKLKKKKASSKTTSPFKVTKTKKTTKKVAK